MEAFWDESSLGLLGFVLLATLLCIALLRLSRRKTFSLSGRYVMVTGCDSGFGRAIARRLDRLGCRVLATCLTQQGAEELGNASSERMSVLVMDVTDSGQIQQAYTEVRHKLMEAQTGLWGLVNNAGILYWGPIEWYPLETFKRLADVNLWGMIDVTKTFLPLVKSARGRIVNLSSISGRLSFSNFGPYSITKYGVEAFSDALRREIAPWGVGVSLVEPGGFRTGLMSPQILANHAKEAWSNLSGNMKAEYGHEFLEERLSILDKWHKGGALNADLTKVVDAVVDALSAERPRPRRVVGADARILSLISHLPTPVEDWIFSKMFRGTANEVAKGPVQH